MAFFLLLLFIAGIFVLGHYGLPEKRFPAPSPPEPGRIMEGAAPYRLEGTSGIAFVICHGFGDSAFNTRPLGDFLHDMGHTAIGVLLPGHGTQIEDLMRTRYAHWYDHLEKVYLEERGRYKQVFLVGFSLGGTLCLDLAARNADFVRPSGVMTISSPVFFNGLFGGKFILHQPLLLFTGLVRIFKPVVKLNRPRPASLDRVNPWRGYHATYAMDALHSFKLALAHVRRGLAKISVPYCSIMAANDRTIHRDNQAYIYSRIQSREKRAFMFILPPDISTMHSLLTHRNASARAFRFIEEFIQDTLGGYEQKPAAPPRSTLGMIRERLFSLAPGHREPDDLTKKPVKKTR